MKIIFLQLRRSQPVLPRGSHYGENDMYARYGLQDGGNREVTIQHRLEPGNYVVIPSIQNTQRNRKYYLRIYTEEEVKAEYEHLISRHVFNFLCKTFGTTLDLICTRIRAYNSNNFSFVDSDTKY